MTPCLCMAALLLATASVHAEAVLRADELIAFKRIDSDRNGYVSRVEARSVHPVEARFEWADVNKDGLLDENEYLSLGRRSPRD